MGRIFDDDGRLLDRDALKSVRFGPVIHGGYSPATGTYVAGVKDFDEQLRRRSDEMSERMGFEVNYRPGNPDPPPSTT